MRVVHAIVAVVFVAAIVIQVFLAGAALLQLGGNGDFATHIEFGYTEVGLAALAVVVTAFLARVGRRRIYLSVLLMVLYIVQTLLPAAKTSMPSVAALHPVNAMLLFGLAAWFAWTAWRDRATAKPAAAA
ncbi:MAG TPA: DUF6220 domain-containing protein [Candidatus Limnocylindrales bacterium]|nr:DUF6220 domain-containing protein [Candidatus Limnocylindrales bacterium]